VNESDPIGTFLGFEVVDGSRYEVFGRWGDDLADDFAAFDVYDDQGNHLTADLLLPAPPTEDVIRVLALRFLAARRVIVRPTRVGWVIVSVGEKVGLALDADWWPRL
jgi:hypothetical protein